MIAVHCEEQSLTRGGHAHAGLVSAELGLGGWPSLGESLMVARDVDLAGDTGQPVHLMHLSARESVEHLRRGQAAGVRASGEVTPHHLCLTDEAVRTLDPNVKMNPPVRSEEDRAALLEAVRDGTIAAIATDHAPHSLEEKDVPFESAPFGVTGLETSFAVLYTQLIESGVLSLETVLQRMSAGPAEIFGLDRPRIALGAPANLTLIDPNATWRVKPSAFRSRSLNSWLLGERLRSRIKLTIAAGRVVFEAVNPGQAWCSKTGPSSRGSRWARTGFAFGEAVFTTSMSGYQEVATDPSFEGQIVCFTAPMVGNYGVDDKRNESRRAHAKAVVMRDARGPDWTDWLHDRGVVGLTGVDTRSLVLHLRERGAMRAAAVTGEAAIDEVLTAVREQPEMAGSGARRGRLCARAVHVRGGRSRARGRRRLRMQALDPAPARGERRGGGGLPARRRRGLGRRLRRRAAVAGPGRPRAAPGRGEDAAGAARPDTGARRSASGTSCSRSPPARRRSSCRSAIAARITPCSTSARAGCSSPRRTTASPLRRATSPA